MAPVNTGSTGGLTGRQRAGLESLPPALAHLAHSASFKPDPVWATHVLNCALCTAAGVLMKLTGGTWSSGDVSADLGTPSEDRNLFVEYAKEKCGFKGTDQVDAQITGLSTYIERKTGKKSQLQPGGMKPQKLYETLKWMKGRPPGTPFAFWLQLGPHSGVCHWLYAESVGQGILFTDYQTDSQELGGRPETGPLPMVGILSKIATDKATVVAVAFLKD